MSTLSHSQLTEIAVRWLHRPNSGRGHGCQVALSECWGGWGGGEQPDAMGWRNSGHQDGTVLVEVKTSRADFLADAKKPHRKQPELGVGRWRYFLCPEGLIQPEEVPERWGLLWVTKRNGVRPVCGPVAHLPHMLRFGDELARHAFEQRDIEREMAMLAKTLHRIPDIETLNKRLREANNHSQHLVKKIEGQRAEIQRLQQRVMELNLRLNTDAAPAPTPPAPRRRSRSAQPCQVTEIS